MLHKKKLPSRRANANTYCKTIVPFRDVRASTMEELRARAMGDKYYKINLKTYLRFGTIEFRHHSGTANAIKVTNWVRFLQAFVSSSVVNDTPAEAPLATQVINSRPMNGTERRFVHRLTRHSMTIRELMIQFDLKESSVRAILGALSRRHGYTVLESSIPDGSVYRITAAPALLFPAQPPPPVIQPERDDLWRGVEETVRGYYDTRARVLRGEAA